MRVCRCHFRYPRSQFQPLASPLVRLPCLASVLVLGPKSHLSLAAHYLSKRRWQSQQSAHFFFLAVLVSLSWAVVLRRWLAQQIHETWQAAASILCGLGLALSLLLLWLCLPWLKSQKAHAAFSGCRQRAKLIWHFWHCCGESIQYRRYPSPDLCKRVDTPVSYNAPAIVACFCLLAVAWHGILHNSWHSKYCYFMLVGLILTRILFSCCCVKHFKFIALFKPMNLFEWLQPTETK